MGKKNSFKVNSKTPKTGVEVNIQGRGITPANETIVLKELEALEVTGIPEAPVSAGQSFTVNVKGSTSTIVPVLKSTSDVVLERGLDWAEPAVNDAGGMDIIVTPRLNGSYKLVLTGESFADYPITVNVKPAETPVVVPSTATVVTADKTISFEVSNTTKNVEVVCSDSRVSIQPASEEPSNKTFNVTFTPGPEDIDYGAVYVNIKVRGIGVNEEIVTFSFREGDIIQLTLENNKVRAGQDQFITVAGADTSRTLTASVPEEYTSIIQTQVISSTSVKVTASSAVKDVPVTIGGENVTPSKINVSFLPASDTLTPHLESTVAGGELEEGTTFVGSYIVLSVSGTEEDVVFSANSDEVKFEDGSTKYEKVITSNSPGRFTVSVKGTGVTTLEVPVEFVAREEGGPQFEIVKDSYTFPITTKKFTFSVKNLEGVLNAKSTSLKVKPVVSGNVVELNMSDYMPKPVACDIILSVDGQEDRIVHINIFIPESIKEMDVAGRTFEFKVGQTIKFVVPNKDENDEITIQASSPLIKYELDVNVVTVTCNDVGSYTLLVKHTEYKDAVVYFEVKALESVTPDVPELPEKEDFYDVGKAPDVSVTISQNGFFNSVFDSQLITDDREKLAYCLEQGGVTAIPLHGLMTYEKETGANTPFKGGQFIARQNYSLYFTIKALMDELDYYVFKGNFRSILKVFKLYSKSAYSLGYLLRFDELWPGNDKELDRYKQTVTWISKYVEVDGEGMGDYVGSLKPYLPEHVINNLMTFCSQKIKV